MFYGSPHLLFVVFILEIFLQVVAKVPQQRIVHGVLPIKAFLCHEPPGCLLPLHIWVTAMWESVLIVIIVNCCYIWNIFDSCDSQSKTNIVSEVVKLRFSPLKDLTTADRGTLSLGLSCLSGHALRWLCGRSNSVGIGQWWRDTSHHHVLMLQLLN